MDDTTLTRIAEALERMAPAPMAAPDFAAADGFVWHVDPDRLEPVAKINRVSLDLLVGIDRSRDTLLDNTRQFARGLPANSPWWRPSIRPPRRHCSRRNGRRC